MTSVRITTAMLWRLLMIFVYLALVVCVCCVAQAQYPAEHPPDYPSGALSAQVGSYQRRTNISTTTITCLIAYTPAAKAQIEATGVSLQTFIQRAIDTTNMT